VTLSQQDVVTHIENTFRAERVRLARQVDRVEALRELRELLFEFTQRNDHALLSVDDMYAAPRDEQERARLVALIDRALPEN
jgi:hypothetical protein